MKRVEELCIKYLMNETDPSETADIRAEMIDDPDALIEYESMRSTWAKVRGMPEMEPPAHITEAVINQASNGIRANGVYTMSTGVKWVAAAAVVVMTGFGIWTSTVVVQNAIGESSASNVAPTSNDKQWVDRNDVLYIQPGQNVSAQSTNVSKLKPVTPTAENAAGNTEIQLAGSRKPAN